ncbi:MAG: hypothetical protein JWQ38_1378 [Flavipsychrobacter sp.]|nr:hypothetical protein [Flavipsychrobacter sp.]
MKTCFIRIVLLVLLLCGMPYQQYAAFPVKSMNAPAVVLAGYFENGGVQPHSPVDSVAHFHKNAPQEYHKGTAIILNVISIFFGGLGMHRMYLGYWGMGVAELLGIACAVAGAALFSVLFFTGSFALIPLAIICFGLWFTSIGAQIVDLFLICTGYLKPKKGDFTKHKKVHREKLGWGKDQEYRTKSGKE